LLTHQHCSAQSTRWSKVTTNFQLRELMCSSTIFYIAFVCLGKQMPNVSVMSSISWYQLRHLHQRLTIQTYVWLATRLRLAFAKVQMARLLPMAWSTFGGQTNKTGHMATWSLVNLLIGTSCGWYLLGWRLYFIKSPEFFKCSCQLYHILIICYKM